mgnify:CR=1 FL=1
MTNRKVSTVLIVGLGSIGKKHLKQLREITSDLEIVALRRNGSSSLRYEGLNHLVSNLEEALSFSPTVAILCNPASKHIEIASALVKEGVNILIEKPISNSVQGVKELIDLSRQNKCKLMVGYNLRFSDSLIFFRNEIHKNLIGKLLSIRSEVGQHLSTWRPNSDYTQSVSAQKSLGGGVLLELSHEIDYLKWIFGSISQVFGHVSKVSSLKIDVEDVVHAIVKFNDNDICSNLTANLSLDFVRQDPIRQCIVVGEEGTLKWNAINDEVLVYRNDKWELIYKSKQEPDYSYTNELLHFINCIEMNKEPSITGQSALDTLHVIEAIRSSSKSNKIMKVDYKEST